LDFSYGVLKPTAESSGQEGCISRSVSFTIGTEELVKVNGSQTSDIAP